MNPLKPTTYYNTYYKILGPRGTPLLGYRNDRWQLPRGHPGKWTDSRYPHLCVSGWHLIPNIGISRQLRVGILYTAEGRGQYDAYPDRVSFESARLLKRVGEITLDDIEQFAQLWLERARAYSANAQYGNYAMRHDLCRGEYHSAQSYFDQCQYKIGQCKSALPYPDNTIITDYRSLHVKNACSYASYIAINAANAAGYSDSSTYTEYLLQSYAVLERIGRR
jgi:hypothetical protein